MKYGEGSRKVRSTHPSRSSRPKTTGARNFFLLGLVTLLSASTGALVAFALTFAPLKAASSSPHLPGNQADRLTGLPATLSRPINILFLGIDNSGHPHQAHFTPAEGMGGNSDTMLLIRLLPDGHRVNILSIPRDTLVNLPEVGTDKINDANRRGGALLAAETVSQLLGGLPIDRYVRVDTEGLVQLIDALGPVEVNIPKEMDYQDRSQNLQIHFTAGQQKLNGQHLEEYVRFRHDEWGDIGRVQRQQAVLKAILQQLVQPATLARLPQLLQVAQANIDTDLSVEEMLAIAQFLAAGGANHQNQNFVMLPGRFSRPDEYSLSYWIANPQTTAQVAGRYFGQAPGPMSQEDRQQMSVAIANATGDPTAAQQALRDLQAQGFGNVYLSDHEIDSASAGTPTTQIIAQQGNPESAALVQQALGLGDIEVESTGDLGASVTVVLGTDFLQSHPPMTRQ